MPLLAWGDAVFPPPFRMPGVSALVQCSVVLFGLLLIHMHSLHSRSASVGFLLVPDKVVINSSSHPDSKCSINWVTEKEDRKYAF